MQRKLRRFFEEKTDKAQIFITTHSKVFFNQYTMENVFLFDATYRKQYVERKGKYINVVETYLVDITGGEGYKKLCDHLGIEIKTAEPLDEKNIIVEGEADKKYISELGSFFGLNIPKIISLNGADNIKSCLDFYKSFYAGREEKPKVKVLFDNDGKGRNLYYNGMDKIKNLEVEIILIKNYLGDNGDKDKNVNYEIEDLVYPEVIVYLANQILKKNKKMKEVDQDEICNNIKAPAFKKKGILDLIEHVKNVNNLEEGSGIDISGSAFKGEMANLFEIKANIDLLSLIKKCDKKYPEVRKFIEELLTFA